MTCPVSRWWTVATAVCVVAATTGFSTQARASGAAYQVDTAEVSEVGSCKVESWFSAAKNHDVFASIAPACVVNLYRPVELSAQIARARSDGEWVNGVAPKIKTNLIPSAIGSWGVALSATVAYDITGREIAGYTVTVPATLRLSNVVRINVNAGWLLDVPTAATFSPTAQASTGAPGQCLDVDGQAVSACSAAQSPTTVPESTSLPARHPLAADRPVQHRPDLRPQSLRRNSNWLTLATIVRFPAREK